jgi:choline dehydrogenase-like flavoprotein
MSDTTGSDTTGRRFDVIVVGSGFGGGVNAARLAEAGLRVLVLERGPWWGLGQADRPDGEWRPSSGRDCPPQSDRTSRWRGAMTLTVHRR